MTTTYGTTIPKRAIEAVCRRLKTGEDHQRIATEELRDFIPAHDDDLSEVSEVMNYCESLNDDEEWDVQIEADQARLGMKEFLRRLQG